MNTKQLYASVYRALRLLDRIYDVSIPGNQSAMAKADLVCDRLDFLQAQNPVVYSAAFKSHRNRHNFVG